MNRHELAQLDAIASVVSRISGVHAALLKGNARMTFDEMFREFPERRSFCFQAAMDEVHIANWPAKRKLLVEGKRYRFRFVPRAASIQDEDLHLTVNPRYRLYDDENKLRIHRFYDTGNTVWNAEERIRGRFRAYVSFGGNPVLALVSRKRNS